MTPQYKFTYFIEDFTLSMFSYFVHCDLSFFRKAVNVRITTLDESRRSITRVTLRWRKRDFEFVILEGFEPSPEPFVVGVFEAI